MTHASRKFRLPLLFFIPFMLFMLFMFILGSVWSVMAQGDVLPLPGSDGFSSRAFGEVQQLTASDGVEYEWFGYAVDLDGDILIEGNYRADDADGAAYIFERDASGTWQQVDKLIGDDSAAEDQFGTDVSLDGNTAVVGAPGHDTISFNEGAVYVFTRDSAGVWSQSQKLTVDDLPLNARFGSDVIVMGDRLIASARGSGTAYIFRRNASQMWQLETDLVIGSGIFSLAFDGDTVLIGTAHESDFTGAAYVYQLEAGSWTFLRKLTPNDGAANHFFASEMILHNNQAFIFARLNAAPNNSRGAVYVFSEAGGLWRQTQKLQPNDPGDGDLFGFGMAADSETLFISSYGDNAQAGSVYQFGWNGSSWVQQDKIPSIGGGFGYSVEVDDEVLVSGAPFADSEQGRVYIYIDPNLIPTSTPELVTNLLVDGGFENNGTGWTLKNATGDKVKCNKEGKVVAHTGNCAWRFKGGDGENAKIQQVITNGANAGDSLTLSGFVNASGAVNSKIKIVVAYLDPSIAKNKITVAVGSETAGGYLSLSVFQPALTTSVVVPVEKIKLQVKNSSTSGKVYYDALSLVAQ
jgi:hypothetical protein